MCREVMLSKKGMVVICQCMECKMITIWHQSILLSFTPEQFKTFKMFIDELDIEQFTIPSPDGESRLLLRTPNPDINFIFTLDQWEDLNVAMEEAEYMQGVYDLINA
jgi:hypothetical protein